MVDQAEALKMNMELTEIPGTSLKVSPVAIGTWAIGGWMWGGTDEAEFDRYHPGRLRAWHQPCRHGAGLWIWPFRRDRRQGDRRKRAALGRADCHQGRTAMGGRKGISQCQPRPHPAGGRGFLAQASNRLHRHLSGSLARSADYDRRNRGSDAHAVRAGENPRHRREQFFGRPDGAVSPRCAAACAAAALQSVRTRTSRPTFCPIAAKTRSRCWDMARCAGACCPDECRRIRFSMATI